MAQRENMLALDAIRRAVGDLREAAAKHKPQQEEASAIAREAEAAVQQLEARAQVLTPSSSDQFVRAADEITAAVRQAEAVIRKSAQEGASSSGSSRLARLFKGTDTKIKARLKEAKERIRAARAAAAAAAAAAPAATASHVSGAAATENSPQDQQQHMQQGHLSTEAGLALTYSISQRLHAVAFVAGAGGAGRGRGALWVSVSSKVEMYANCRAEERSEVQLPHKSQAVTCIAQGTKGNVWTGHADGSISMHTANRWCASQLQASGQTIRSMSVDEKGLCWVGDEGGQMKVIKCDPLNGRLFGVFMRVAEGRHPQSDGYGNQPRGIAPVAALQCQEQYTFAGGGSSKTHVTMWQLGTYKLLDTYDTYAYGACSALTVLPWDPSPASSSVTEGVPAHTASAPAFVRGVPVPAPAWRLLSGHESGQVLLWEVVGMKLRLVAAIGEASGSPVKGIAPFAEEGLLVVGHASGLLSISARPCARDLPSAASAGVTVYKTRCAKLKAHRSGMNCMASLGHTLVTASTSGFKTWQASQLQLEAQSEGVVLRNYTSAHMAQTAPSSSDSAATMPQQQQQQQQNGVGPPRPLTPPMQHPQHVMGTPFGSAGVPPPFQSPRQHQQQQQAPYSSTSYAPHTPMHQHYPTQFGSHAGSNPLQQQLLGSKAAAAAANMMTVPASNSAPNPMSLQAMLQQRAMIGQPVFGMGTMYTSQQLHMGQYQAPYSYAGPQQQQLMQYGSGAGPYQTSPPQVMQSAGSMQGTSLVNGSNGSGGLGSGGRSRELVQRTNSHDMTERASDINIAQIIPASELTYLGDIAQGAEGKVYLGRWNHIQVAMKEYIALRSTDINKASNGNGGSGDPATDGTTESLLKEVQMLNHLTMHPNVVRFCGVCLDPPLIITEYYSKGSLYHMLQRARKQLERGIGDKIVRYLSWPRRLEMLHDIAAGMVYLHNRHFVHGDLRSPNLFVSRDGKVKIGDFGFARRLKSESSNVKVTKHTNFRWVAPEVMMDTSLSKASDVYSFGVVMWEVLTWRVPYESLASAQVVFNTVLENKRPEVLEDLPGRPAGCLAGYKKLMEECWAQDPRERPTFTAAANRLKALQLWESTHRRKMRAAAANGEAGVDAQSAAALAREGVPSPSPVEDEGSENERSTDEDDSLGDDGTEGEAVAAGRTPGGTPTRTPVHAAAGAANGGGSARGSSGKGSPAGLRGSAGATNGSGGRHGHAVAAAAATAAAAAATAAPLLQPRLTKQVLEQAFGGEVDDESYVAAYAAAAAAAVNEAAGSGPLANDMAPDPAIAGPPVTSTGVPLRTAGSSAEDRDEAGAIVAERLQSSNSSLPPSASASLPYGAGMGHNGARAASAGIQLPILGQTASQGAASPFMAAMMAGASETGEAAGTAAEAGMSAQRFDGAAVQRDNSTGSSGHQGLLALNSAAGSSSLGAGGGGSGLLSCQSDAPPEQRSDQALIPTSGHAASPPPLPTRGFVEDLVMVSPFADSTSMDWLSELAAQAPGAAHGTAGSSSRGDSTGMDWGSGGLGMASTHSDRQLDVRAPLPAITEAQASSSMCGGSLLSEFAAQHGLDTISEGGSGTANTAGSIAGSVVGSAAGSAVGSAADAAASSAAATRAGTVAHSAQASAAGSTADGAGTTADGSAMSAAKPAPSAAAAATAAADGGAAVSAAASHVQRLPPGAASQQHAAAGKGASWPLPAEAEDDAGDDDAFMMSDSWALSERADSKAAAAAAGSLGAEGSALNPAAGDISGMGAEPPSLGAAAAVAAAANPIGIEDSPFAMFGNWGADDSGDEATLMVMGSGPLAHSRSADVDALSKTLTAELHITGASRAGVPGSGSSAGSFTAGSAVQSTPSFPAPLYRPQDSAEQPKAQLASISDSPFAGMVFDDDSDDNADGTATAAAALQLEGAAPLAEANTGTRPAAGKAKQATAAAAADGSAVGIAAATAAAGGEAAKKEAKPVRADVIPAVLMSLRPQDIRQDAGGGGRAESSRTDLPRLLGRRTDDGSTDGTTGDEAGDFYAQARKAHDKFSNLMRRSNAGTDTSSVSGAAAESAASGSLSVMKSEPVSEADAQAAAAAAAGAAVAVMPGPWLPLKPALNQMALFPAQPFAQGMFMPRSGSMPPPQQQALGQNQVVRLPDGRVRVVNPTLLGAQQLPPLHPPLPLQAPLRALSQPRFDMSGGSTPPGAASHQQPLSGWATAQAQHAAAAAMAAANQWQHQRMAQPVFGDPPVIQPVPAEVEKLERRCSAERAQMLLKAPGVDAGSVVNLFVGGAALPVVGVLGDEEQAGAAQPATPPTKQQPQQQALLQQRPLLGMFAAGKVMPVAGPPIF